MQGLIGRKLGMTQVFDDKGKRVAVTVIDVGPCVVVQRKTKATDGYDAVQLGYGTMKEKNAGKPAMGRFKKAGVAPVRLLREFPVDAADEDLELGAAVGSSIFEGVSHVDVIGTTKGRGFQGVVKRYNMAGGRMTHGGHSKRRIGSIGQCSYPARVAKGQRMPGHMGNKRITQQNLRVVEIRVDENLVLVMGAIPGPVGGFVIVKKALKKSA
ncbi:MAG: 50S ribosomal protein L3 [Kiritimatiellae bacterium]|nr:50S ribosomal protein L3 [Kiritimatiellia bacterium]